MKWIRDEEFIRGNIPMTKFNIRILAMAYLSIHQGDKFLDLGAGTGSISIEAGLQGASVWAIEREEEGIDLIKRNSKKFDININTIKGQAPEDLPDLIFNKCFIGGSGGRLREIFQYLETNLADNGIVCANFITLKNLNEFNNLLEKCNYKNIETNLIQTSYIEKTGLFKGQNPIFIVKGVKCND